MNRKRGFIVGKEETHGNQLRLREKMSIHSWKLEKKSCRKRIKTFFPEHCKPLVWWVIEATQLTLLPIELLFLCCMTSWNSASILLYFASVPGVMVLSISVSESQSSSGLPPGPPLCSFFVRACVSTENAFQLEWWLNEVRGFFQRNGSKRTPGLPGGMSLHCWFVGLWDLLSL